MNDGTQDMNQLEKTVLTLAARWRHRKIIKRMNKYRLLIAKHGVKSKEANDYYYDTVDKFPHYKLYMRYHRRVYQEQEK